MDFIMEIGKWSENDKLDLVDKLGQVNFVEAFHGTEIQLHNVLEQKAFESKTPVVGSQFHSDKIIT
jgi:hypothetical protein